MSDEQETPADLLASRLIDAWCEDKGKRIPWSKAIQIVAIVTKQTDAERDRLLHLGDEDGSCEMCGRDAIRLERELSARDARIAELERVLSRRLNERAGRLKGKT